MAIGFGFRSSLSRHSQTVNEHEHTHSLMRVATAGLTSLCVCVHVSPVVATLIKLCVCVSALRWFLFPSMHPQAPGQAPATNFDPPRILNCTTSATLLLVLWDGVYHCSLPKTCLALCEHSLLFASLRCSCPRPRCVLPLTLYMVQEHALETRQFDIVSEKDNLC